MIEIQLQKEDFEQDIRALLMAFYPNTPIRAVIGNDMPKIGMPPAKNQVQPEPFHFLSIRPQRIVSRNRLRRSWLYQHAPAYLRVFRPATFKNAHASSRSTILKMLRSL